MDQLIHLYGFFVAAILVYRLLLATHSNSFKSPKLMVFVSFLGSMGLGALNEIVEFVAFVSFSQTGVGDLYNTGLDLIFNMIGALFGAFVAHKIYKK
jgi:putative membrane protein